MITLSELKLYYLADCVCAPGSYILYGECIETPPSLTGWIKYWRKRKVEYNIVYPKRKRITKS